MSKAITMINMCIFLVCKIVDIAADASLPTLAPLVLLPCICLLLVVVLPVAVGALPLLIVVVLPG